MTSACFDRSCCFDSYYCLTPSGGLSDWTGFLGSVFINTTDVDGVELMKLFTTVDPGSHCLNLANESNENEDSRALGVQLASHYSSTVR